MLERLASHTTPRSAPSGFGEALGRAPSSAALSLLGYATDTHRFYDALARRLGDPYVVPTFNGALFVTSRPDLIRELFATDPDAFEVWTVEALAPMLGAASVLLTSGERHRRDRKLLTPPLHGARLRAHGQAMRDVAERVARERMTPGARVSVHDAATEVSVDVIARTVFGIGDAARLPAVRAAIRENVDAVSPALVLFPPLRREMLGVGPWDRFLRSARALDAMLVDEIAARRATGHAGDDILGLLLAARYDDSSPMADADMRDQLRTMLIAGHETTAIALTWALDWIHRTPRVRDRLVAELDALGPSPDPERIAQAPYLDAVCLETLRLHPIVPDVVRLLVKPIRLGPYELPAGIAVCAATTLLHAREDLYPDPFAFEPERHLVRKFGPSELMPFGGGHKRCLGAAFATYEMKIVLATWLSHARFRLVDARPLRPRRRNLTLGPNRQVRVDVEAARRAIA